MLKTSRVILAAAISATAFAAAGQTMRIRGTIEGVERNGVTFRSADGAASKLILSPNAMVVAVVTASISDIKEGTFLGSAAVPQPDGTQRALEVHIFPEAMRGAGEGHRPYAPVPQGTMTNGATSGTAVTRIDGTTITVRYRGGSKQIVIPAGTPIVRYEVGSVGDLKPGARFTVAAATSRPDGSYEVSRINVGRDGVIPR